MSIIEEQYSRTIKLLESNKSYFISNKIKAQIDYEYQSKGYNLIGWTEKIVKKDSNLIIYWNNIKIFEQDIKDINFFSLAITLMLSFSFAIAVALDRAFLLQEFVDNTGVLIKEKESDPIQENNIIEL